MAWVAGLVVVAVVSLAMGELGSRWWIRRRARYYVWQPGLRLELRQDPRLFAGVEPQARFDINADGERGSDVRGDEAGLFRVLVAGGSAAECLALDQSTSWPGALERLLNSDASLRALGARRAHVGNIGRSGVGSERLDLIFEHVLPQYRRLSVIVILVGASDVLHWLESGAPPTPEASSVSVAESFAAHPEQRFGWKPTRWATIVLGRRLLRLWLRPVEVRAEAGSWVPVARQMRAQAKELRTRMPDPASMLDRFEHHFRRLLGRAQAHADRVLVVRQPWFEKVYTAEETAHFWHGGVGKPWKETVSVHYAQGVLNQLMGLLDARAAMVSDALGVEHLDVRPVLTPSLEHYFDMFHYTPTGATVVAQAVCAALLPRSASARPSPASVELASFVGLAR